MSCKSTESTTVNGPNTEVCPGGVCLSCGMRGVLVLDGRDNVATCMAEMNTGDAVEMTVDPVFAFNREMPEQPREHTAIERFLCGDGTDYDDAPRELELPDGRIIDLPSIAWLDANGLTEDEYLEPLGRQAALIIEQTSGTEEPIVLVDNSDEQTTLADGLTSTATAPLGKVEGEGCGCQSSKSAGWVALFAFLLPGRRRRG